MICDLAEYYHIYYYEDMPAEKLAVLVYGLDNASRIKRNLVNRKLTLKEELLAHCLDALNYIAWTHTEAARKGKNRPKSVYQLLTNEEKVCKGFSSGEDFEKALSELRG